MAIVADNGQWIFSDLRMAGSFDLNFYQEPGNSVAKAHKGGIRHRLRASFSQLPKKSIGNARQFVAMNS
jgi:hypothetical protein